MHTHIYIAVLLPIISRPISSAHPCPDTQACPLLPLRPPLTHAMPKLAMGGKPWGQKGGSARVGGSAKGDVPLL